MKVLDRTVETELVVKEMGPTSFVANPSGGVEFSYGGTAMLLESGITEVEDYLAQHVVGKYPAYRLGAFGSKREAEDYLQKVSRGE